MWTGKRYTIEAFRPTNQGGGLLISTWHTTEASRDMELSVFRDRMQRGEVSYVEVIDHENGTREKIFA